MGVNKFVFGSDTKLDLTSDTVNENNTLLGVVGHSADGEIFSGKVKIQHYYTGNTTPSSSLGEDGDIYLEVIS